MITRRLLTVVLACTLLSSAGYAQSRGHRISVGLGALYEKGFDATLSYEHELRHHNAYEIFASGYLKYADCLSCGHVCPESFWHNYKSFCGGVTYKPCVLERRNSYGCFRLGAACGTDNDGFIAGFNLGYERNYALSEDWYFYWQLRTDIMIAAMDVFRGGITLGIKFPVYNKSLR